MTDHTPPATEPFEVRSRWTGNVLFIAHIAVGIGSVSLRLGAAVQWAVANRADLTDADLTRADLTRADLGSIRADLFDVLVTARAEAPGFLAALREGRVNGAVYEGKCACLVGTIANLRGVRFSTLQTDPSRPIERFVMGIRRGDTPLTNPVAALVAEWTALFIGEAP